MEADPVTEIFRRKTEPGTPQASEDNIGRSRGTFSSIPTSKGQQNWKYRLASDGDENYLGLENPDGGRFAWRMKGAPSTSSKNQAISPLRGKRLADPDDISAIGKTLASGLFQVHKSDTGSIYGTMQDGKVNNSLRLTEGDAGKWTLSPTVRTKIQRPAEALYRRAVKKAAASNPYSDALPERAPVQNGTAAPADILAYPLVAPPGGSVSKSIALGAGLGAVGGAGYHLAGGVKRMIRGDKSERPGIVKRMLLGGLVGAGVSAGANALVGATPQNIRQLPGSDPVAKVATWRRISK